MRVVAAVLLIAGITATVLTVLFPKKEQRHHIYYCRFDAPRIPTDIPGVFVMDPRSGLSMPCMYRKNDPVDV